MSDNIINLGLVPPAAAEPEPEPQSKRRRVTIKIVARVDELPTALAAIQSVLDDDEANISLYVNVLPS
jgi:hypothetical protein